MLFLPLIPAAQKGCGTTLASLDGLMEVTRQATQLVLAGCALYFFAGLVVNLAQAQLATATGDPSGYAHALQQAVAMVILLVIAAALPELGAAIRGWLLCTGQDAGSVLSLWQALARLVAAIVLSGAGMATTVAIVWSTLGLQTAQAAGLPAQVAHTFWRILVLLIGGVLTGASVLLANHLLTLLMT